MKAADGAIINRKGLQWEFSPEKLMLAEKWLIQTSNNLAKPVMIQSQLLESMLESPEPARADLAEVANLVQLGADVFMLTTETSNGKFAQESMKFLAKTIAEAEQVYDYDQEYANNKKSVIEMPNNVDILAHTACQIAFE